MATNEKEIVNGIEVDIDKAQRLIKKIYCFFYVVQQFIIATFFSFSFISIFNWRFNSSL